MSFDYFVMVARALNDDLLLIMNSERHRSFMTYLNKLKSGNYDDVQEELAFSILAGGYDEITIRILKFFAEHFGNGNTIVQTHNTPRRSGKTSGIIDAHLACLDSGYKSIIVNPLRSTTDFINVPEVVLIEKLRGRHHEHELDIIFIDEYWNIPHVDIETIHQINHNASIIAFGTTLTLEEYRPHISRIR